MSKLGGMSKVVLENLVKTYPGQNGAAAAAVQAINLEIESGEFMVLVGPSGCGKSTTLRLVAGLEEIDSGSVSIDGRVVNTVPPKDRDIAMVFQNYALYPHMSVYENMAFGLKLRKIPKAEIDARVREASALLGLDAYLGRKPKALSGGQRQRVAVGRAIVRKPKVFLFDEPLSNLDAKMRASMRTEIARLHARLGATMIYVTHDQVEAMTMGDRICVMKDGRIMQVAEPLTLYKEPANLFVAGFIGSPTMNFFRGRVQRGPGETLSLVLKGEGESAPVCIPLTGHLAEDAKAHAGGELILGLRPENFQEAPTSGQDRAAVLEAVIDVAEPMGAETYLYLKTPACSFVARVKPSAQQSPGQRVTLALDLSQAHLFDPQTEKRLISA
jgi:multiple sugar transport system ATP-binding protein